jgi:hypothetical protein
MASSEPGSASGKGSGGALEGEELDGAPTIRRGLDAEGAALGLPPDRGLVAADARVEQPAGGLAVGRRKGRRFAAKHHGEGALGLADGAEDIAIADAAKIAVKEHLEGSDSRLPAAWPRRVARQRIDGLLKAGRQRGPRS